MANDSPYSIGAGEGIDRTPPPFDAEESVHPREYGVMFRLEIRFGDIASNTIVGRFPDTPHSERQSANGTAEESIFTQAEIAEIFLKGTMPTRKLPGGKWKQWSAGDLQDILQQHVRFLSSRAKLYVDEMVNRAKREWRSIVRSKKARNILGPLNKMVKELVASKKKHYELARQKAPDFDKEYGSGSIIKIEAGRKAKQAFYKTRRINRELARSEAAEIKKIRRRIADERDRLYRSLRSRDISDAIAQSAELMRYAEDSGLDNLLNEERQRLIALTEDYAVGSKFETIVKSVAKKIQDEYIECLASMKQPPLAPKTIYNRRWRGITSTIPLYESGEFAESFYTEVK